MALTTFRMLTSLVDRLDIKDVVIDRGNSRVDVRFWEDFTSLHSYLGNSNEIERADPERTGVKRALGVLNLHIKAFEYEEWYIFCDETNRKPKYS